VNRSLATEGDLRSVHSKNAGITTRGAEGGGDRAARKKTELHQTPGNVFRQSKVLQNALLPHAEIQQRRRLRRPRGPHVVSDGLENQLQHSFIMD
jgi:hypothetical protein